ncbi:MAG: FtsH protease activity modulator HflK [Desulfobacterales bacterium]|nr:MAG: FtsH protease activity modulator HflK [Desulfobacterales bacterium]
MSWDWERLKAQQEQQRRGGPPQLDDFLKKFNEMKFPGGSVMVVLLTVIVVGTSMVYSIQPNELGVVLRFGKFVRNEPPGLHFKLPAGIEKVYRVNARRVETEEFTASLSARSGTATNNPTLMLTGDLNVAVVPWIVQYRIKDDDPASAYDFLFKVKDVQTLLRDMSEATMRLVIGDRSIDEVISNRDEIALEAKDLLQEELDKAETGIYVVTVEMKRTNVPVKVQPFFNEVNQAVQEKEQMIYRAREEYNTVIPAAQGQAERTIKAAEGYAVDRVNRARGDADRFLSVYAEYAKAADVTQRRLYLETMKKMLPRLEKKIILDETQRSLLPLLNLNTADMEVAK